MTIRTGNARLIKEINTSLIMEEMRKNDQITRNELARLTGLTPPTVLHIVADLIDLGLVREMELGESSGGRRPRMLQLNPDGGYVIGVEIDDDFNRLCLADLSVRIRAKMRIPNESLVPEKVLASVSKGIESLIEQAGVERARILGVGMAVPGLVDSYRGICVNSTRLGWQNVHIKEWIEQQTNLPTEVDHSVRVIALAESRFGAAANASNMIFLRIGRGIGAAFVIDDLVYQGSNGSLGELGHMVVWPHGPKCRCGLEGCLEAIASEEALVMKYREVCEGNCPSELTGEKVVDLAETDKSAALVCKEAGYYLGVALANCVKLINPELIVITGYLKSGTVMWEQMRQIINEQVFPSQSAPLRIVPGELVENACVLGGCALVLDEIYSKPRELRARIG
ncbi:MAG: ROK family transcriptional regulator [Limnochordia bacterium]|jgi:predicted NBD/HSP70 family sugar kinase